MSTLEIQKKDPKENMSTLSEKLSTLQSELEKSNTQEKKMELRKQILELRRELNRTQQFTTIASNKLSEGKTGLDSFSASDLMKLDKETGLSRGEFLSKSFLYKRTEGSDGTIYEESTDGKNLKEGDILYVDFGKNQSADNKIGAGDTLDKSIKLIEVDDGKGNKRIGKRSIRGNKVGYYDEKGYIPIRNGFSIKILGEKDVTQFDATVGNTINLSTDDTIENEAKDKYIAQSELAERVGPRYSPSQTPGQREFIMNAKNLAEEVGKQYNIPEEVVFAQAVIESGWGTSEKAKVQNNYFGMTKGGREKGFRDYANMSESFHDYGQVLSSNKRYSAAFAHKDNPTLFLETILKAGYIDASVDNYDNYMRTASEIIGKYSKYSTTHLDYNTRGDLTANLYRELGGTRESVEKNLTSVVFLGKAIQVHKAIVSALDAADKEIREHPEASKYIVYNAGGFNWRTKRGGDTLSNHALGLAIDINPEDNMGDFGDGGGDIPLLLVNIMKKHGFLWGGDWKSPYDPMHFEFSNLENLKVAKANVGITV